MSLQQTRRTFLGQSSIGALALSQLIDGGVGVSEALAAGGTTDLPHHPPRCKRIIHLYMAGGPSHLETFDYKPKLKALDGKPMPESMTKGQPIAQLQGKQLKCYAPRFDFKKYGASGQEICTLFPHMGSVADEMCIIRSMYTEQINHDPAHTFFNTGTIIPGRPSMGSWITYGLGSTSQNLPGFVVLSSVGKGGQAQPIASRQWSAGFLPSRYQGVEFRSKGDPVLYVGNPDGVNMKSQRRSVNTVNALNRHHFDQVADPEIQTRIAQYELAYRMQSSVPGLMDIKDESEKTFEMYGTRGGDGSYAANCLLARRLVERGVRFVQVYHRAWDHHGGIEKAMETTSKEVDQATAALMMDLKQRGMLDDTLIIFGGEFGRTPMAQGSGRDHHIKGYSYMLAGGGIKPGVSYGATDELGYNAEHDRVSVHDLHATILHLLGVDHARLSVKFQGLDIKLTGVEESRVIKKILG